MTKSKTRGLGRGFDVLMPSNFNSDLLIDEKERIQKLFINDIKPNPHQPRRHFDEVALSQLADSISRYGILQPLVVTQADSGYQIVAGERRWRAASIAGLKQVPVIVRTTKELERLEIAIVENVQRVDLSPLEQAASIQKLHDQFSLSYAEIGARLGKAVTTINNIVRLLQLPVDAQKALREHEISEGHARAILALKEMPEKQTELLAQIKLNNWSVREAEQFVLVCKRGAKDLKTTRASMRIQTPQTKLLGKRIDAPVTIRHTAHGGKLEIGFKNEEDLERIISQLAKDNA